MKTAVIIAEYNPYHLGHHHQSEILRRDYGITHIIAITSGNFLQRGTPAISDKFIRSSMAVADGIDLVIELPTIYATGSAEFFAGGGVSIANSLGGIDFISFGCETPDKKNLLGIAEVLRSEPRVFKDILKERLKEGKSFPEARSKALKEYLKEGNNPLIDDILTSPNNILAIEYIKAMLLKKSNFDFIPVKREGLGYHEEFEDHNSSNLPSATAIRKIINKEEYCDLDMLKKHIPPLSLEVLKEGNLIPKDYEVKYKELLYYKLSLEGTSILKLPDAKDGLGERILNNMDLLRNNTLEDFIRAVNTRRFTYSRINRLLLHFLLGFENLNYEEDRKIDAEEARILALNEKGMEFMANVRKTKKIELIQSMKDSKSSISQYDKRASALYELLNPFYRKEFDYTKSPRIIKKLI